MARGTSLRVALLIFKKKIYARLLSATYCEIDYMTKDNWSNAINLCMICLTRIGKNVSNNTKDTFSCF